MIEHPRTPIPAMKGRDTPSGAIAPIAPGAPGAAPTPDRHAPHPDRRQVICAPLCPPLCPPPSGFIVRPEAA